MSKNHERALASTPTKVIIGTPMKEFDQARKHISNVHEHGRRTQHELILLGIELNKQKAALGVKAGRPSGKFPHAAEIKSWDALVVEQTGLSLDTCDRWMKIAKGAQKSIPLLMASDVLEKPFSALPEKRQREIEAVLHKAVDGKTMHEMMNTFGVWKEKKKNAPPKATKESAKKRAENAADETLSAATLMATAKEQTNALHDHHVGGAWKSLDTADLADLETKMLAYHADVKAELEERRKVKPKK